MSEPPRPLPRGHFPRFQAPVSVPEQVRAALAPLQQPA